MIFAILSLSVSLEIQFDYCIYRSSTERGKIVQLQNEAKCHGNSQWKMQKFVHFAGSKWERWVSAAVVSEEEEKKLVK